MSKTQTQIYSIEADIRLHVVTSNGTWDKTFDDLEVALAWYSSLLNDEDFI